MNKLLWNSFFLVSLISISGHILAFSDADNGTDDDDRATVHLPMTYTEIYVPVAEIARIRAETLAGYAEWSKVVAGRIDLIENPSKNFFNHYADSRAGVAGLVAYLESLRTSIKKTKTLFRLQGITSVLNHTPKPETVKVEIPTELEINNVTEVLDQFLFQLEVPVVV